jgi:hypothetical protein
LEFVGRIFPLPFLLLRPPGTFVVGFSCAMQGLRKPKLIAKALKVQRMFFMIVFSILSGASLSLFIGFYGYRAVDDFSPLCANR